VTTHPQPADPHARGEQGARRELAELLAGARDLDGDYDSSIELARHLQARRAQVGEPTDIESVVLDLEACLRSASPLPDDGIRAPRLTGQQLVAALQAARTDFDRRIRQHLAFARTALPNKPAGTP
jgi:hypothetical protein